MLIWLGVVATVLAVVGTGLLYAIFLLVDQVRKAERAVVESTRESISSYDHWGRSADEWAEKVRAIFLQGEKEMAAHADRILSDWKQAGYPFVKAEQELSESLAALLREIKVSKALAQGALAVVEQNVLAVDKLWQMVELIRTGPRVPSRVPQPEDDAQGGENLDQEQAIRDQLANVAERMKQIQANFQE